LLAEVCVAEVPVSFKPTDEVSLHWLALNLTPGLGATKGRKLVEHFGGVAHIFKASRNSRRPVFRRFPRSRSELDDQWNLRIRS
jgi:hypothetical protein